MVLGTVAALAVFAGACGGGDQKSDTAGDIATSASGALLPKQTSQSGEVEVAVAPTGLSAAAVTWDFKISIDSQGAELNEDLMSAAVLVDDSGREYMAVGYEGDPPGGTHREGIVKFAPISPEPKTVTLKLRGVGGIGERSFAWTMGVASLQSTPQAAPTAP
ncbi:MAG: hypothetical protein ACYCXF_05160 [Thermoleophilia bacterium]